MQKYEYLHHITFSSAGHGRVRVAACLRCGFSVAGKEEDLLRRIVQQHECRGERGPQDKPPANPAGAARK